jgi:hypothetical protein
MRPIFMTAKPAGPAAIGRLNRMNSIDLNPASSTRLRKILRGREQESPGVEYDQYAWASSDSPKGPTDPRRASVLVIRSGGEMDLNGCQRRVDPGDILIIPPCKERAGWPGIDLWCLSAALLILLATARILLDLY